MFPTKVVGFKKNLLILSVWPWVALLMSGQGHINFFKHLTFDIPESNIWYQELSKTLYERYIFSSNSFRVMMFESYNTAGIT